MNINFPGVLYPNGASHNDIVMETTTDADEERNAIIKTVKLKNFILGLRNVFVSIYYRTLYLSTRISYKKPVYKSNSC